MKYETLSEPGVEEWQASGKAPPMRHVSATLALGSAFIYGAAAVSMNFVNKLTLQVVMHVRFSCKTVEFQRRGDTLSAFTLAWPVQVFGLANTLLFFQMTAVVLVIVLLKVQSPLN